jgi:hypothetical protein
MMKTTTLINLERAALKALTELKSMSAEALSTEVISNKQDPLVIAIRELNDLSEKEFRTNKHEE